MTNATGAPSGDAADPAPAPDARRTAALPGRTIAGYAAGSVGTGGFATLPGLVLVYYLTDARAVPAAVAGVVVAVAKIWDVLVNPFVGYASDRDRARTGSRRRLMTLGGLALPVFFAATFAVPGGFGPAASAIWVFVSFVVAGTAFGMFQVPYLALPAELSESYDERTRLLGWRVVTLALAILLFGAGGPALRGDTDSLGGYLLMGVVSALVIGVGMVTASRVAPVGPTAPLPSATLGRAWRTAVRDSIAVLRESQPFRALLLAFVLQAMATGLMLAGANYVATYVLSSDSAVTFLFAALIAPAIACMPPWTRLAARYGKERAFLLASVLFAAAALALVPLTASPGPWAYVPTALAGVAYAGMQALPMAMLPDVIAHDAARRPSARGGAFAGVWTAGETTGMAIGAWLLSLVLALTGYRSSSAGHQLAQPTSAIDGIALAFSAVPALLLVCSIVALVRYRLRKADIEPATEATP